MTIQTIKKAFYILTFSLAILITGCASVHMASPAEDKYAKEFKKPSNGKGSLYIVRDSLRGQTSVLELSINGMSVAKTAPNTFVQFELPEGRYYIGSRGENYEQRPLYIVAGQLYFFRQNVSTGWNDFRTDLSQISDQEGRAAISSASMASKMVFDEDIRPIQKRDQ